MVFKEYCAIKAHYTQLKYDYFKMNGKTRAGKLSFQKRHDKHFFVNLAKKRDYFHYIVANVAYDNAWIGDISLNSTAEENYKKFLRNKQSLSYVIKQDISKLKSDFRENFMLDSGSHPYILKAYINQDISLETMTVLTDITSIVGIWDRRMKDDPLWNAYKLPIIKHKSFLTYRKDKIVDIILDTGTKW